MIIMRKDELRALIREAVIEALTVDMTIERLRDPATGMPLAVPKVATEKVFLPSAIMQVLPYHEGALRGLQTDLAKHSVSADELRRLVEILETAGPVLERLALAMNAPRAEITSECNHDHHQ